MACHAVLAALVLLGAAHAAPAPQLPAAPPAGAGGSLPPRPRVEECQRKCGGVDIPFPFGTGADHCMLPGFHIDCRDTPTAKGGGVFSKPKPFLGTGNVELINVSRATGQAWVFNHISSYCYDTSSRQMKPSEWYVDLRGSPYTFSDTANKFTVVGSRTLAYIGDSRDDAANYTTGCVTMCRSHDRTLRNGSCSGMGCCQTAIPTGLQYYKVWFDPRLSAFQNRSESLCSYAVLLDSSNFTFSTSYLTSSDFMNNGAQAPVVLDWAIGQDDDCGHSCVARNSRCISAASRRGYICDCKEGFRGDPYLPDGCQDINECDDPTKYHCFGECTNKDGTFTCSCPAGTQGNASIGKCQKDPFPPSARLTIGIFGGLLVALIAFLGTEVFRKKRRNKRQGYFEQHGGQMLLRILKAEGIHFTFFDRASIVKATCNFRRANIIGEGAHGTVYKGVISVRDTTTTVAVKRCKQIDKSRKEEFVQELAILCRVRHPNIVKLLGCCLHFEAPMLVYEFVQNGTLKDLLHGKPRRRVTTLATRLRIAAEAAEALAHLHSPPHTTLHGDVKPENILLDEVWVAKVSDFGCSTLDDNVQVVPKGTLAYLDPEFLQDFQITDKTDVYSLGVVLMELLTGKKPPSKDQKNLKIIFEEAMGNGTLAELMDDDIIVEEGAMGVVRQAAELARRCTAVPGTTRPAMRQVAEELRRLSNGMPERPQELQALEGPEYYSSEAAAGSETGAFYSSVGIVGALSTELAR